MKKVIIVTHGEECIGQNPFMSEAGKKQIRALRELFPFEPSCVVAGNANRYICTADALEVTIDWHDSFFGDGSKIIEKKGKLLKQYPDGFRVPLSKDKTEATKAKIAMECFRALPCNTLICAGRGLGSVLKTAGLYSLGFNMASMYEVEVYFDKLRINESVSTLKKVA